MFVLVWKSLAIVLVRWKRFDDATAIMRWCVKHVDGVKIKHEI